MIRLDIKKKDGSHYWREYFETQKQADAWLAGEQTKFYWDNSFTWTFTDIPETPPHPVDTVAKAQRNAARDQIKAIIGKPTKNPTADFAVLVDALGKILPLDNEV